MKSNQKPIGFEEAREIILGKACPLGIENLNLAESLGRVLAADLVAGRNLPPWNNSAMDGFAVRARDVQEAGDKNPVDLKVIGDLPAGKQWKGKIRAGETVRIMTGAPIPAGADAVVRVEITREINRGLIQVFSPVKIGTDLRRAGEDVRAGSVVLKAGTEIRPAEIGILAAMNNSLVPVYQKPRVSILATGDEISRVGKTVRKDRIISSNSYALAAQVIEAGGIPLDLGIARDNRKEIRDKLSRGLKADIILTSAGVSVGEYDFVKDVYRELKIKILFQRLKTRPGQPLVFGRIGRKPVFGLPGNPVSSMICFEEFIRPLIRQMIGRRNIFRSEIQARAGEVLEKSSRQTHFLRCRLYRKQGEWWGETTGPQGSGILSSMVKADGILIFSEGRERIEKGDLVRVQLLRDEIPGII
ncbi:MAG: molybdopterin molybdotransferase MoeA [Proteobacteria bacterium]|nr:molybdopterin molybdotransferase MoeA [Pseudomonadota bacterium]